jgi:hypothetical protein
VSSFAGKLSGSTAVDVLAVADWVKLWPKFEPTMAALLDIYPPMMREAMQGMMQVYPTVYSRLGPVLVGGIDFDGGISMQMHVAPPDAEALLAEVDTLVKRPEFAKMGMMITAGAPSDRGGAAVRDYMLTIDPSRMAAVTGAAADDEKSKAVQKQMAETFQAMFGSDGIPMRMQVADGSGVISIGKIGSDAAKAGASTSGVWSAGLQPALTLVSGCNPMFVERIDFAAMMRGMASFMSAAERGRMPLPPADAKADIVVGGGMGATVQAMTPR